ncbi:hypothetical protein OXX69_003846 [Metschnikowia pulcherrima]
MPASDDSQDYSKHSQKKRIRVACNNCRKKKIKCDGENRCMNCEIAQEPECVYDEKISKPAHKKARLSKSDEILTFLNARLDRLEGLIESVAAGTLNAGDLRADFSSRKAKKQQSPVTEDEDEESRNASHDDGEETSSPSCSAAEMPSHTGKQNELYLGNHSFFSILSKSSLNWMKSHLSEENAQLLVPLINLPFVFENKTKSFVNMWYESKSFNHAQHLERMKAPFPRKREEAMFELVHKYASKCNTVSILCSSEEVETSLKKYYSHARRELSITQLFKLCSAVLICLSEAMDHSMDAGSPDSCDSASRASSSTFTLSALGTLRDDILEVCMGYYYQLSIRGHGLETVKAMLFFAVFMAKCCESPEVLHMVLTTAIRKALEMGLHRIETYRTCTREDFDIKILVWKTACYFDMEICFRSGRPPLINYNDTSEELRDSFSMHNILNTAYSLPFLKHYDQIFELRLETYNRLFSARADTKTFDALKSNVDYLNQKMFNLLAHMDPDHRPYFYNQPGFHQVSILDNIEEEHIMTARLTFFLNMMTINRLPMMFAFPNVSAEVLQVYRNLSLNSARSIMYMLKNYHAAGSERPASLWITFFPLISVIHLSAACMAEPKSPDAHADLTLIIETCETWFNRKMTSGRFSSVKFDMSILLQVLVKSVSRIAISIFEMNTGIDILAKNDKLKELFDSPKKFIPELFGTSEDLKKSIPLLFESKSPFPSDGTPGSHSSPCSLSNIVDGGISTPHNTAHPNYTPTSGMKNGAVDYGNSDGAASFSGIESMLFDQIDQFPNFFFDGVNGGL